MPLPYSLDLRWRIVWAYLTQSLSQSSIALLFNVSERTVRRLVALFNQTGSVKWRSRSNGPERLMGDFEQMILVQLIFAHPGIFLNEIQQKGNCSWHVMYMQNIQANGLHQTGYASRSLATIRN